MTSTIPGLSSGGAARAATFTSRGRPRELKFAARTGSVITCWASAVLVCGLGVTGCGPRATVFRVTDYRSDGPPQEYFEAFDECFYCVDARGHTDIVARRRGLPANDGTDPITQVVHVRRVWAAVPGRTYADRTMINATVSYQIVSPTGGAAFDGGGFVTFRENRKGTEIRGKLESSDLKPRVSAGTVGDLFSRASVTGEFRAIHDERRARLILNEMQCRFGPKPPYDPPRGNPNLR